MDTKVLGKLQSARQTEALVIDILSWSPVVLGDWGLYG